MSKYRNYATPLGANGKTKYFALECGHLVSEPKTKLCKKCQKERWHKKYPNFIRYENKHAIYYALECEHEVGNPNTKNCIDCVKPKHNNGTDFVNKGGKKQYKASMCGHLVTNPLAKYCADCRNYKSVHMGYQYKRSGKEWEHRRIAEKSLGRRLASNEVVHHINGDKKDNRNCNLLICNHGYHTWLHNRMSLLYAKEKFGSQNASTD